MLYLILPYFDFNQSTLPKNNLDLFISNYAEFKKAAEENNDVETLNFLKEQ